MSLSATETMHEPRRWPLFAAAAAACMLLIAYAASPFVSFYRLSQAAQAGDTPSISERVNFPKLRRSIARQLAADAADSRNLQGVDRRLAIGAGTVSVAAWLEEFLSPATVADLIAGRPLTVQQGSAALPFEIPPMKVDSPGKAIEIWWHSGFTTPISYRLATSGTTGGQSIAVDMELERTTWRVTSLQLSQPVREELLRRIAIISEGKSGGTAPTPR